MGLSIHFKLKFQGSEKEVIEKLELLQKVAKRIGFKESGPLWYLDYSKNYNDDIENKKFGGSTPDSYRWAKIQCEPREVLMENKLIEQHKGWVLYLWAGEGCEPTNIGLITKDGFNWEGSSFTKTQYAEEFVKCHLLVCNILEACKIAGMLEKVDDEGHYWETKDLSKLAENINAYTDLIAGFTKTLKEEWGADKVIAPIDESKNYIKVKNKDKSKSRIKVN